MAGRASPIRRGRGDSVTLSERALVLVANRLASPGSEHALAQWLENDFVCDRHGRRWIAAWRDDTQRKASRSPRVRAAARQLQQWYRTLDQLLERKAQIEHALYLMRTIQKLMGHRHIGTTALYCEVFRRYAATLRHNTVELV